ncbi:MAG TPA: polysaccharide deacetylase family protein [Gammaproteobacteria bacterium]|nr:polysaccharide deacetylase family protein [Gammaproteobacteria bacterium]
MLPAERIRALCVSVHDVAPATWPECASLLRMLDAIGGVRVTLLVVPDYHRRGLIDRDSAFLKAIEARLARGDEVALHGYYHLDDAARPLDPVGWFRRRVYTVGEGEFDALPAGTARERMEQGLALLRGLGWPVTGFVAPAWLLGRAARGVIASLPFRYTTTMRSHFCLPRWQETPARSLVYSARSALRRDLSRRWNESLFRQQRHADLLRVSLHPVDARHEPVVGHWHDLVERALIDGRQPVTKQHWTEAVACAGTG